ncbi:MAG TPA: cupin domain-containing protein [Rhizomicrobium sp.]
MTSSRISNFSALMELQAAPINPDWILDGAPVARNRILANSTDRFAWTMLWDCTAGQFNWIYTVDETVHVIEGSVTVTDMDGSTNTLGAGDIAFFPAGTTAHWHIENYVRKVAFCQRPVPLAVGLPLRTLRRLIDQLRKVTDLIRASLAQPVADTGAEVQAPQIGTPVAHFKDGNARLAGSRSPRV